QVPGLRERVVGDRERQSAGAGGGGHAVTMWADAARQQWFGGRGAAQVQEGAGGTQQRPGRVGHEEGPGGGGLVLQERHDQGGTVLGQRTDRDSSEAGRVQASEQGGRQRSGVHRAGHTGADAAGQLGGEGQAG